MQPSRYAIILFVNGMLLIREQARRVPRAPSRALLGPPFCSPLSSDRAIRRPFNTSPTNPHTTLKPRAR